MNLSYIDWYLVELRQQIRDRVSFEKEVALLSQSQIHLESLAEDFVAEGMGREESEKSAIERFGKPEDIAKSYVDAMTPRKALWLSVGNALAVVIITMAILLAMIVIPFDKQTAVTGLAVTFAIVFGLWGLLAKRMPGKRAWVIALAAPFAISLPAALCLNFYVSSGGQPTLMTQGRLEELYGRAVKTYDHLVAIENKKKTQWQEALKDSKLANGIPAGATYSLPAYRVWGSKGVYITGNPKNGETSYTFQASDKVLLRGQDIDLGKIAERDPELLKGPMTLGQIQAKIDTDIKSMERSQSWNRQVVHTLGSAVSQPVLQKILFLAGPTEFVLLTIAIPSALLSSFLGSRISRRKRKQHRKLRLA